MPAAYYFLKKRLSWRDLEPSSLLGYYRYISLLVTSGFYLVGGPKAPFHLKAGAVVCLLLEARFFTRVYRDTEGARARRLLIFVETLGLASILVITGGLDSPFIWYAVNPILLSATVAPVYYCWLMMTAFLSAAMLLQRYSLYTPEEIISLWPDRSFFFMVFVLTTFAAQIFTHIIARLSHQAETMKKQLEHIKALYEAIEMLSHYSDPHEVANLFASYSRTITGADKVIVWVETQSGVKDPRKESFYVVKGPRGVLSEEDWYPHIKSMFENRRDCPEIHVQEVTGSKERQTGRLVTVRVKSSSKVFGVLSAYYSGTRPISEEKQTLTFMADLCAAALEKRFLESLADELLLMEEKDRIAGEIHDNVTQNIFGLIYGLDTLIKKEHLDDRVRNQLRLMQKTAQRSLRELRTSIYSMSSAKNDKETLADEIEKYLSDLAQLNNVAVEFSSNGGLGSLTAQAKRHLYRIVREATGNAIRHGNCGSIKVSLATDGTECRLVIVDDGAGFDTALVEDRGQYGLGLVNMKELARNLGGDLNIESPPGRGTVVSCAIPLYDNTKALSAREKLIV